MQARSGRRKPPLRIAYLRAIASVYLILISADWVRYAVTDEWVAWPWVVVAAVLRPIILTAIT